MHDSCHDAVERGRRLTLVGSACWSEAIAGSGSSGQPGLVTILAVELYLSARSVVLMESTLRSIA